MSFVTGAGLVAAVLFVGVAILQISLAAGAPLGRFAWGGAHRVLPRHLRVGSLMSAVVLCFGAWAILARVDVLAPGSEAGWVRVFTWVLVAVNLLSMLANIASKSSRERYIMAPIAAALALGCFLAGISP